MKESNQKRSRAYTLRMDSLEYDLDSLLNRLLRLTPEQSEKQSVSDWKSEGLRIWSK